MRMTNALIIVNVETYIYMIMFTQGMSNSINQEAKNRNQHYYSCDQLADLDLHCFSHAPTVHG